MIQTGAATTAKATTVITNSASHAALRPKKGELFPVAIIALPGGVEYLNYDNTADSYWIGQVICWDRGRPARHEREARKDLESNGEKCAPERRVCGRDARGPSKSLDRPNQNWMPCDQLVKVASCLHPLSAS